MLAKWKIIVPIGVLWLVAILWGMHALLKFKAGSAKPGKTQVMLKYGRH